MPESASSPRLVAGCMTGTSIDALDCALVRIDGHGFEISASLIATSSRDLGTLRSALRSLAEQKPMNAGEIATIAHELALLHAAALDDLTADHGLDLVCVHGQTVFHAPPVSWQLMNPWPIVHRRGVPVVFDLRSADLAAGGQGAPITPLADYLLFSRHEVLKPVCCVVNLGGFANVTAMVTRDREPHGQPAIHGFDICACNQLLNLIARSKLGAEYDNGGIAAARGRIDAAAAQELAGVLLESRRKRRSLGTGDESFGWVHAHGDRMSGEDLSATACDAIAQTIVSQCKEFGPIVVAGGGVKNQSLLASLRGHAQAHGSSVLLSDQLGVPAEFREAMEFAVLGALCQDRVPITIPSVTRVGSPAPISGSWAYPTARE